MSPTFLTTTDGDIVLRAGPEPDSKHDFRVHKFILSLASPVFKDMLAFPPPPDQTSNEHQLPVVDVLDPQKSWTQSYSSSILELNLRRSPSFPR